MYKEDKYYASIQLMFDEASLDATEFAIDEFLESHVTDVNEYEEKVTSLVLVDMTLKQGLQTH